MSLTEQAPSHPTIVIPGFGWVSKMLGVSSLFLTIAVVVGLVAAYWFGQRVVARQDAADRNIEMVVSNLKIINEQTVIREIVDKKIGSKLDADIRGRIAFEIYDGCRKYQIPVHLVLGLIEQESGWNPSAHNPSGAEGLMQIMADTSIRYFKARGRTFTISDLQDPITNVSIGIEILADKQEAAIAQGKSSKGDFIFALYYYCGKGDTYAREVVAKSVSYKKTLDSPLAGKLTEGKPSAG